ncbi:glycoside hydrolase family 16 protein [Pendulispora rubella]|uniref:Glycoside hydrolase family 16 protein n=1 Tax=Pendulispora rubella TaxID=2741070 RepID=A0ABZ2KQC8_9BACT
MKYLLHGLVLATVCGCTASSRPTGAPGPDTSTTRLAGWQLAWSDEFELPDGSPVDPATWTHELGGDGWGNEELQYYTDGTDNAVIRGGALVMTAKSGASTHSCWYGACRYTSARLVTKGKFEPRYGRIEARIRVPAGKGMWPAFWLLGANMDNVGWPQCGEIDVMENVGHEPHEVYGSLHGDGYSNENGLITGYTVPGAPLSEAYHRYAVEWEAGAIRFYVDDVLYSTRTPADVPPGRAWAFDHPFYILLNVAVGGTWPGDPDEATHFPQTMQVDWVRAYVKS